MIKLTVALPMFRAKHIGWLSLESLIRQSNVNFEWELVIAEEDNDLSFGYDNLMSYENKLSGVGCTRIKYIPIEKWIPLSHKWKIIADNASNDSVAYVLQAADCYSAPGRLSTTLEAIENGADWTQYKKHVLYNIITKKIVVMNRDLYLMANGKPHNCGAEMATRVDLVRQLPNDSVKKSVDNWMYKGCQKIRDLQGRKFIVNWDKSDNWIHSLNVHGLNNISARNKVFKAKMKRGCAVSKMKLTDIIPTEVAKRLESYDIIAKSWDRLKL